MHSYRHFSEYRQHDYRTPRSMRECYGWDAPLCVDDDDGWMSRWSSVMLWIIVVLVAGALVWTWII